MSSATIKTKITGRVKITDKATGEVLLNKKNAVHNKNMAIALARGLSNDNPPSTNGLGNSQIYSMRFGSGGSVISSGNTITYLPPNVTDANATLYNETYSEVIDDFAAGTPAENSVTFQNSPAPDTSTIVICTCTIAAGEPVGQFLTDSPAPGTLTGDTSTVESMYEFDELGLFTSDDLLLTHIIFSPILKTANRELVITYTLTISVS